MQDRPIPHAAPTVASVLPLVPYDEALELIESLFPGINAELEAIDAAERAEAEHRQAS